MKRLSFLFLFITTLLFTVHPAYAEAGSSPEGVLRIGILVAVPSFNLGAEGSHTLIEMNTEKKKVFSNQAICLVEPDEGGIRIGNDTFRTPVQISPDNENEFIRINGKRYRGSILLKKNSNGTLTVINETGLDGYLNGILPREVSPDWPMESLKAQAVVSRTFALKNLQRHNSEGFNLCSSVHCQVYGGLDAEKKETNLAVEETRNEVLTYDDDLINSVFFANCGGQTEDPANAWESFSSVPYLKPVRCKYCRRQPHYRWEKKISQEKIADALKKNNRPVELPIHSIKISHYGKSGRAKFLKIKHSDGELRVRASHFRLALGPETIRSTLFTEIRKVKGGFFFEGRGWGHGVGMCQDGAKGFAEKGADYKKILKFYYPKTKLMKGTSE